MKLPSVILGFALMFGSLPYGEIAIAGEANMAQRDEEVFSGKVRPPQVPLDWRGEPLPGSAGWRWYNPANRLDSVRLYRGDPKSPDSSKREPYVVITKNGELIGRDGRPLGVYLKD